MDDLMARLTDIFWRYQTDFRRMAHMSEIEAEQVTKPFRREVGALSMGGKPWFGPHSCFRPGCLP